MQVELATKKPLNVSFQNWAADKTKLVTSALDIPVSSSAKEITQAAKKLGYDSVILDYSPVQYFQKEVVVFDASQIRVVK